MRSAMGWAWRVGVAAVVAVAACSDAGGGGVAVEDTAALCRNASDDDGDGHTDCADQDCWDFVFCAAAAGDTRDSDGDGPEDTESLSDAAGDALADAADGSATHDGTNDSAAPPACDPCGMGAVTGRVCAPSENVFVNDALVVIAGTGCDGQPFALETRSAADGTWSFAAVPCGSHVVTVTKASFERIFQVTVATGHTTDLSGAATKQCFQSAGTPIAVLDGNWDDMATLLLQLGLDFDRFTADGTGDGDIVTLLGAPSQLAGYDVLFVNCGGLHGWMPQDHPDVMQNVKDWVLAGGSLYLSDYAWTYGEWSFPDAIEFQGSDSVYDMYTPQSPQLIPSDTTVTATVADGNMAAYLGKTTMVVTFDQGPQIAPDAAGPGTFAHVVATFGPLVGLGTAFDGTDVPLVLSYVPGPGAGRVIYTNFHNDAQTTSDMLTLLHYLVFTL